ncbi:MULTISPECIES: hypothetical protein [unclassified Streptomyces]|uniref:hypothetical protein n=1 Tax=unclassified Streptomyces TaxID=2593676 RepID=UPI00363D5946
MLFGVEVPRASRGGRASRSPDPDIRIRHGNTVMVRAQREFGWISPAARGRLHGGHPATEWGK